MRIISKFYDYYDKACAYGIDTECIYLREDHDQNIRWTRRYYPYNFWAVSKFYVGFAGNIYPCVAFEKAYPPPRYGYKRLFFYSEKEAVAHLDHVQFGKKLPSTRSAVWKRHVRADWSERSAVIRHFNSDTSRLNSLFVEHHVPIFIWQGDQNRWVEQEYKVGDGYLMLDPSMKDVEFYKIKDAVSAFQEIHQFLSGVLGNVEKDLVVISDKDQIVKKGFDLVTSFRKAATKKR